MVRTHFYFYIGIFWCLLFNPWVFAQNPEPRIAKLRLETSAAHSIKCQAPNSPAFGSAIPANQYSQCTRFFGAPRQDRLKISEKRERFSLEHIRDASSLMNKGGSHLYQATNTIPLFSDMLKAGIEMVYRDPFLSTNSIPSATTQLGTLLVLRGSMKKMKYRAEYGYSGQNLGKALFVNPHDRVGGKFRWEWQLPFLTPKVELSRFVNNVNYDPTSNQTISTRQLYSLDWTIPDWPDVILIYSQEEKDSFSRSEQSPSDATLMKRVTTRIGFEHPIGKGEWSSQYSTFQNKIHDHGMHEKIHTTLKGTLFTLPQIDISPSIGFTQQTNANQHSTQERLFAILGTTFRLSRNQVIQPSFEWTQNSTRRHLSISKTFSSKLEYSYHPSTHGYHISLMGQYVFKQNSQQQNNPQTYDISLFVRKDLHDLLDLPHQQKFISLKLTHNQHFNASSFAAQGPGTNAMLLLTVTP